MAHQPHSGRRGGIGLAAGVADLEGSDMTEYMTEYCPWCQSYIEVRLGTQPCPKCGQPIRVTPDTPVIPISTILWALRVLGVRR